MIKRLIKYGTAVGIGAVVGYGIGQEREVIRPDDDKFWEGEDKTFTTTYEEMEGVVEAINWRLDDSNSSYRIMEKQDLLDVRTEYEHKLAEAEKMDKDEVEITLSDRKRLRMLEAIANKPVDVDIDTTQ